jgi:hypothetical protein
LAVTSDVPTNRTVAGSVPQDAIPASQETHGKGGRLSGVDKEGSDTVNVIILQTILVENRMVHCFLGHKGVSKYFKKDSMTDLMNGLTKHSNPVVKTLNASVLDKRIKETVDAAKEMTLSNDHEKLAKFKDNVNDKNSDTGDNIDAYDKCILQLPIEEEKLTSGKKEEEKRKKANQEDQSVRLQSVSKVASRVDAAEQNTRKRNLSVRDQTLDKQLEEEENELELVEEEWRDPDQMNVDERGEDLVQEVRDRTTAPRVEVPRLREKNPVECALRR